MTIVYNRVFARPEVSATLSCKTFSITTQPLCSRFTIPSPVRGAIRRVASFARLLYYTEEPSKAARCELYVCKDVYKKRCLRPPGGPGGPRADRGADRQARGPQVCHCMVQPLVELYGGCMEVAKGLVVWNRVSAGSARATCSRRRSPGGASRRSRAGSCGVVFCVLFIQCGREKSSKGAYLEISSSSKH